MYATTSNINRINGLNTFKKTINMEKLFSDSEVFQKERPTTITDQQEQDFYKKMAEEIIKGGWSDDDVEDIMKDMAEISEYDSGYEIAKALEAYRSNARYDIDTEFIGFLDDFGYHKGEILTSNIKEWVKAHNPQHKFQKGQKLILETTLNHEQQKGMVVFVTGFNESVACYWIDEDETRKGGTVIPYEEVERCCLPT
jgi:hypothetical protein